METNRKEQKRRKKRTLFLRNVRNSTWRNPDDCQTEQNAEEEPKKWIPCCFFMVTSDLAANVAKKKVLTTYRMSQAVPVQICCDINGKKAPSLYNSNGISDYNRATSWTRWAAKQVPRHAEKGKTRSHRLLIFQVFENCCSEMPRETCFPFSFPQLFC